MSNTKRPMIMSEVPRQRHTIKCKTCKEDFSTPYSYQIYCHNPCRLEHVKKPKKPKVVRQTNKQARMKKEAKERAERQQTLENRKWLTRPL